MKIHFRCWLLIISFSFTSADKDNLPLCPTNLQYFPQNLPMHCRMPGSAGPASFPQFPTLPPLPGSFFQSPSPDKQPRPIPIPIPPFPGMPGGMPGFPGMPGPPGMPGMPGMPIPMPIVGGGPPHKVPVIVMPFYSPDKTFNKPTPKNKRKKPRKKKRHHHIGSSETDSSEDKSSGDASNASDEHGFWKVHGKGKHRGKKYGISRRSNAHQRAKQKMNEKKDLLTPILQYVTKDGYVIFEKQISKNEAKDWLGSKNEGKLANEARNNDFEIIQKSVEETPHNEIEGEALEIPFRRQEQREREETTTRSDSIETMTDAEPVMKKIMKHRQKKVNNLINHSAQSQE